MGVSMESSLDLCIDFGDLLDEGQDVLGDPCDEGRCGGLPHHSRGLLSGGLHGGLGGLVGAVAALLAQPGFDPSVPGPADPFGGLVLGQEDDGGLALGEVE
ncbi:hypothetical protein GCM10027449_15410 [Sinomonas notoginsengisoli]|uniref:hypothetical protein n=1 Tax=Sinomonas notoginsengisoli TaxID=1457311 RepID=UPI001F20E208|nr:hypothetical protein [Sinomonas notoginsengisoli]